MCVCVSRMSSQMTSLIPRKAPKRGRKPNSSGPADFCRICASSFTIHLKIAKVFKNGVALVNYNERDTIVQQRVFMHSMTCYGILCPKSPALSSENFSLYFASLINRSTSSFVDTTTEGIPSSFISSICFNVRECHSHICISFSCRCLELINQTFLKASWPNCNNVFRPKKMNSLYLLIFK